VAASLHRSVQSIDNRKDIADYIALTTTNTRPRPHVEYHSITSAIIEQNAGRAAAPAPIRLQQQPAPLAVSNGAMQPAASFPPQQPAPASFTPAAALPLTNLGGSAALPASASAAAGSSKFIPPPVTEKFVPPPAPSASVGGVAVALYDFEGAEAEDLSFRVGDVINLRQADEAEDWWNGELRGRTGIFPKTYVRRQTAAEAALSGSAPPQQQQAAFSSSTPEPGYEPPVASSLPAVTLSASNGGPFATSAAVQPVELAAAQPSASSSASPEQPREMDARCEALFDFVGQDVDELSFSKGEQLVITGELNGWYLGKRQGTNQVGIFPSNYVHLHA
jgi:hypothetical protein